MKTSCGNGTSEATHPELSESSNELESSHESSQPTARMLTTIRHRVCSIRLHMLIKFTSNIRSVRNGGFCRPRRQWGQGSFSTIKRAQRRRDHHKAATRRIQPAYPVDWVLSGPHFDVGNPMEKSAGTWFRAERATIMRPTRHAEGQFLPRGRFSDPGNQRIKTEVLNSLRDESRGKAFRPSLSRISRSSI